MKIIHCADPVSYTHLDTQYINDWSLGLDIKILLKTIVVVLKKDGSR